MVLLSDRRCYAFEGEARATGVGSGYRRERGGAEINAFHVIGGLFAVWALLLTGLGVTREGFPSTRGGQMLVGSISVLFAVGAIGSGIITSALEGEEEEGEAAGSEPAKAAEGGRELRLSADRGGDFRFDKEALEARGGPVTLAMENPSSIPHNVSLEGAGVDEQGKTVGSDETSTVSATLKRGRYEFYCSVPGHREGGMEGTLTVR